MGCQTGRRLGILVLALGVLVPSVTAGQQPREAPGGARLVKATNRKNEPVCFVVTPMNGAQAVVQGPRVSFRTDVKIGATIARSSEATAGLAGGETVELLPVEARALSPRGTDAKSLIAWLYAGRPLVLTWKDVKGEQHTARIDPAGFAAAHDAAVKECGWPVSAP